MSDALLRQWTILQSIPRHPRRIKIAGILALLQLQLSNMPTYRTIQRDLDRLAGIFHSLKMKRLMARIIGIWMVKIRCWKFRRWNKVPLWFFIWRNSN